MPSTTVPPGFIRPAIRTRILLVSVLNTKEALVKDNAEHGEKKGWMWLDGSTTRKAKDGGSTGKNQCGMRVCERVNLN